MQLISLKDRSKNSSTKQNQHRSRNSCTKQKSVYMHLLYCESAMLGYFELLCAKGSEEGSFEDSKETLILLPADVNFFLGV